MSSSRNGDPGLRPGIVDAYQLPHRWGQGQPAARVSRRCRHGDGARRGLPLGARAHLPGDLRRSVELSGGRREQQITLRRDDQGSGLYVWVVGQADQ